MATVATTRRYTPDDLLKMPEGERYELIDGQLVERNMSTQASHVASTVNRILGSYCEPNKIGWVLSDSASYQCFSEDPDRVRRPDSSFIRVDRMSLAEYQADGHTRIVPDAVVEVVSPNDEAEEVEAKVHEFIVAGTKLVWVVYPKAREVHVHRAKGPGTILHDTDDLGGEDVIPGFHCKVSDLFQTPLEPAR